MTDHSRVADAFRFFGLATTEGFVAVDQAYRELKLLYGRNSLATYSLVSEDERLGELAEIDKHYRILTAYLTEDSEQESPAATPDGRFWEQGAEVSPGAFLRECRESDDLSLQSIAVQSKIGTAHLENIEAERYDRLPAPVYLRGFIVEFARLLRVTNPEDLTRAYLRLLAEQRRGE